MIAIDVPVHRRIASFSNKDGLGTYTIQNLFSSAIIDLDETRSHFVYPWVWLLDLSGLQKKVKHNEKSSILD
jgi:hypothetical protein